MWCARYYLGNSNTPLRAQLRQKEGKWIFIKLLCTPGSSPLYFKEVQPRSKKSYSLILIFIKNCSSMLLQSFLHLLPSQPIRAIRLVMPLLVTEEAYSIWWGSSPSPSSSMPSDCHCFVTNLFWWVVSVAGLAAWRLADLFIEQVGDDVA